MPSWILCKSQRDILRWFLTMKPAQMGNLLSRAQETKVSLCNLWHMTWKALLSLILYYLILLPLTYTHIIVCSGSMCTVRIGSRRLPVYHIVVGCLGLLNILLVLIAVVIGIYCKYHWSKESVVSNYKDFVANLRYHQYSLILYQELWIIKYTLSCNFLKSIIWKMNWPCYLC